MSTPLFFQSVSTIIIYDPLAEVLGASHDGIIIYGYSDVVKLAGHSCPTVAGAYLMLQKGLKCLYEDKTPVRGEVKVYMKGKLGEGVVGVMANVASLIIGSTDTSGFHGLRGKFDRRNLLIYEADIDGEIALERVDNGARVTLSYHPEIVSIDPKMQVWLEMIISNKADFEIKQAFKSAWQDRVKKILIDNVNNPDLIICKIQK
ncbi:MAG TPA: hypothetical protein PLM93_10795 [Sulfuricurvum sp.]|jgi:hypothetical protein|nr:MAG: hypothetical protein B7Y30_06845 [Campylobacterales bacterium 16-40-21]OZA02215.1 MAG: hypothetical protein B7X89_10305 [Sulfuricurvum sp. 17-40-25]HQS67658.1 hypothetical protein [Sulfuricurvum sp.]HQT36295.1 hypothetical protein [Sulfuricurvum sp.]